MTKRTKIAFVCRWGQSPPELLERFKKQTPYGDGIWIDADSETVLVGVPNQKDADWTVILGDVSPVSTVAAPNHSQWEIDFSRAIYVQRELAANGYVPPNWNRHCARIINYENAYCLGIWWIERPFKQLMKMESRPRPLKIGTITTAKVETEGHRLRLDFLQKFSKKAPDLLDIWGKDEQQLKAMFGSCYRGSLPYNGPNARNGDKSAAIEPYPLSFAFENCFTENYFSEKLLDVLLLWSFPLYWGCPNLIDFFPYGSFSRVDLGSPYLDVDEVIDWVKSDPLVNIDAMREARNRILWKHNLWAMLSRVIETGHV